MSAAYVFSQDKLDEAIANFALDKATSREGRVAEVTATEIADLLRAFFNAPTSAKLRVQPSPRSES